MRVTTRRTKKRNILLKQLDYHINNQNGNVNQQQLIDEIRQNCVDNMVILCKLIDDDSTVNLLQNLSVDKMNNNGDNKILASISKIISNKWWNCPMIKYKYFAESNLIDVDMDYFYDKIDEIMNLTYIPNKIDIIKHNKIRENNKYYNKMKTKSNNKNVIDYQEKDAIKLFTMPLYKKANIGFTVCIPEIFKHRFVDPINNNSFVKKLRVKNIFNSKTRPYLIDCYVEDSDEKQSEIRLSSQYILKKGDDMRFDHGVLEIFNKMNEIWKRNGLNIKAMTYKCIPIGNDIGIIEMKSNCISLNRILELKEELLCSKHKFLQLISSCVAAFIAGFVCGVRDRHYDNILIHKQSVQLFHIDFGYIFGHKTKCFDASTIPITAELKQIFDLYQFGWNEFVENAKKGWIILRENAKELIVAGRELFKFNHQYNKSNIIELFLRDTLKLNMTDKNAEKYIYNQLQNSPNNTPTKIKNLWHDFEMLF